MYLYVVLDTSIYIPLEFERRFGIPMEAEGETPQDMSEDDGARENDLKNDRESVFVRKQEDGTYVLYVKSGDHNRPLIEQTIRDLQFSGKTVSKAILTRPDEKLIRWYFKTKFL